MYEIKEPLCSGSSVIVLLFAINDPRSPLFRDFPCMDTRDRSWNHKRTSYVVPNTVSYSMIHLQWFTNRGSHETDILCSHYSLVLNLNFSYFNLCCTWEVLSVVVTWILLDIQGNRLWNDLTKSNSEKEYN